MDEAHADAPVVGTGHPPGHGARPRRGPLRTEGLQQVTSANHSPDTPSASTSVKGCQERVPGESTPRDLVSHWGIRTKYIMRIRMYEMHTCIVLVMNITTEYGRQLNGGRSDGV